VYAPAAAAPAPVAKAAAARAAAPAPVAGAIDKDPAFAPEAKFYVDEKMFTATYSAEVEAQRSSEASFYKSQGLCSVDVYMCTLDVCV